MACIIDQHEYDEEHLLASQTSLDSSMSYVAIRIQPQHQAV